MLRVIMYLLQNLFLWDSNIQSVAEHSIKVFWQKQKQNYLNSTENKLKNILLGWYAN